MGDDLVARPNPQGHERQPDGVGAVAQPHRVFHPMKRRQLALEPFEHRAHDILAAFQHGADVFVNLGLEVVVLADMAVKLDFHGIARYWSGKPKQRLFWAAGPVTVTPGGGPQINGARHSCSFNSRMDESQGSSKALGLSLHRPSAPVLRTSLKPHPFPR